MKSNAVLPLPVCSLPNDDALAPLLERLLRYARSKLRNEAMAEDAVSARRRLHEQAALNAERASRRTTQAAQ